MKTPFVHKSTQSSGFDYSYELQKVSSMPYMRTVSRIRSASTDTRPTSCKVCWQTRKSRQSGAV